jgi:endonuclease YncB( thermonuclease family)
MLWARKRGPSIIMRTRTFTSLRALLLLPAFALGTHRVGKVLRILDGDTLVFLDSSNTRTRIRLAGIDCPEKAQAWGRRAPKLLAGCVFAKDVTVDRGKRDQYGWTPGTVIADGRNPRLLPSYQANWLPNTG